MNAKERTPAAKPGPSPEARTLAAELADQLGETAEQPRQQLLGIVHLCGADFAREMLKATLEAEANGGLMLADGSRRRTPGGVFFHIARGHMPYALRQRIFPTSAGTTPEPAPFEWNQRGDLIRGLALSHGEVESVKITLIGRPGKIETRKDLVVTTMVHSAKSPTLPRGVPAMPVEPTPYAVYISARQWKQVAESLANPDDVLIVEGTCAYDPAISGIAVFAMHVTTRLLDQQRRESRPVEDSAPPPVPTTSAPAKKRASTTRKKSSTADLTPDDARRLAELQASATLLRQKIASLQTKPPGKRSGLEMTRKLLKDVERDITTLERRQT